MPEPMTPEKPIVPEPVTYHNTLDYDTTRKQMFDGTMNALKTKYPIENDKYRLSLNDLRYEGPEHFTLAEQKQALLKRKSLYRPLRGTWQLTDKTTNKPIDTFKSTVAHVPYLSPRGTYIINGSEYSVASQLRLRSGVYTRKKENGELESHFNVLKGGPSFRVSMEPETGVFRFNVGQAKLKLYPVLKAMGKSDKDIQAAWGNELFQANIAGKDTGTLEKVWERLADARTKKEVGQNGDRDFKKLFENMELDPTVTKHTLGEAHKNITPETIMRATQKILNVSKGTEDTDDRDSMAYQETWNAPDLLKERINKDAGRLGSRLLWRATLRGNLSGMPSAALNPQIESLFFKSGVAQPLEEVSPLDPLDQNVRVTRMGEGGMSSDAIPEDSRSVQPSHFGFIDCVRSPECFCDVTEVMTEAGWKYWKDVTLNDKLACMIDGQLEYHRPYRLIAEQYVGIMHGGKTEFLDFLVTPNHKMWVRPQASPQKIKKSGGIQVAYAPEYKFELMSDTIKKGVRRYRTGGHKPAIYTSSSTFSLPKIEAKSNNTHSDLADMDMVQWAAFMGWYLSEGCTITNKKQVRSHVNISQLKSIHLDNWKEIEDVLIKLRIPHTAFDRGFNMHRKQLAEYTAQFGDSYAKYIPDYIFTASVEARQAFIDAILKGDGRRNASGVIDQLCTCSKRLAEDFARLMFTMGKATRITFEPDNRKPDYIGCYVVNIHSVTERVCASKTTKRPDGYYYTMLYAGMVYCAEVPGHLLYTRRYGSAGFWSGNSGAVGVDLRLATDTYRGTDKQLYSKMINVRTGKPQYITPTIAIDSVISFPGELAKAKAEGRKHVRAMANGRLSYVSADKVQFEAPSAQGMFSHTSNLVPFAEGMKPGRLLMAASHSRQALPLQDPEAPLVQSAGEDGKSYYDKLGNHMGIARAKDGGTVTAVTPDGVTVRDLKGNEHTYDLYNQFPLNRKTQLHSTAVVKPGDVVQPGALLAHTNFTDKKGTLATGRNLRVAYIPWKGQNHEDAISISESAAHKLTSEHMYTEKVDKEDFTHVGHSKFLSLFPSAYNKEQLSKIASNGVIKPGTIVHKNDPLILSVKEKTSKGAGMLYHGGGGQYSDSSVKWEHDTPGIVTDVYDDDDGLKLAIKTYAPCEVGDKLSARHANKGVIGAIIPDKDMPHDKDGKPFEVLLNPLGLISRINPSQAFETVLGKIAEKRGSPYIIKSFSTPDLADMTLNEMKMHGVSDTEDIIDPANGRVISKVLTGKQYIMKLHHTAAGKASTRALGAYSSEGVPASGGEDNPKRIGLGEMQALISHGAVHNIQEIKTLKGTRNDDYWQALSMGYTPPSPNMPAAYKKFMSLLQAAGINVHKKGEHLHLTAMTDKDVDAMSSGEIKDPSTVKWLTTHGKGLRGEKALDPVDGGLFDRGMTGGHGGSRWTHCTLPEPIPQPAMADPIRRLLNLTNKDYESVIAGQKELPGLGSGGTAIKAALQRIQIDPEIEKQKEIIKSAATGAMRDDAIKKLKYLTTFKNTDMKPEDLVVTKVPILPPIFRPITANANFEMVAGVNLLYMDLLNAKKNFEAISKITTGEPVNEARLAVYKSMRAVTGLGDPIKPDRVQQGVKGVLHEVFGNNPKCYDDQTEILTIQGWQSFKDYDGKLPVGTLNPVTDAFEWQIPEDVIHESYSGNMVHTLTNKIDCMVTPNHKHWVRTRVNRNRKYTWTDFNKVDAIDLVGTVRRVEYKTAATRWYGITPDYCFSGTPVNKLAFASMVGWWLAEGWNHPDGCTAYVCQTVKNIKQCADIDLTFSQLGLPYQRKVYPKQPNKYHKDVWYVVYWSINDKTLVQWLTNHVGNGCANKRLSNEILDWDQACLTNLLLSYLDGDGDHSSKHNADPSKNKTYFSRSKLINNVSRFSTVSQKLVDDIQQLTLKLGLGVNFNKFTTFSNSKWLPQQRASVIGRNRVVVEYANQTRLVNYTGNVHCVTVPNGLVFVRRNNKVNVSGNSGLIQRKLLGTSVDMSARAVISPNPDLDIDHVGIPEDQAWKLYGPFVTRRLIRQMGNKPEARAAAIRMVVNRDRTAMQALQAEMEVRPVLATRAPALHRYSIMALKPVLTKAKTMQLSPGVNPGFGSDNDGDCMNFHVVVSDKAVAEANAKMLPSQNLRGVKDFNPLWFPRHEFQHGLYLASTKKSGRKMLPVFDHKNQVLAGFKQGKLSVEDVVSIKD